MGFTLKLECDAGSSIDSAFLTAIVIADKLDVCVEFIFNDVTCMAFKNGNIHKGVNEYYQKLNSTAKIKIATS